MAAGSASEVFRAYATLLKPRVMTLVVYSGFVGLLVAPGSINPLLAAIAVFAIAAGAGAAAAINMWFDRDIDAIMQRTRRRPIPSGQVTAEEALGFGVILSGFSVLVMGLALNWVAAATLAGSIGFYVFVYTMWLKRRTAQNIVIGGAAGAFPPVIGWAAVTGDVSLYPIVLFAIIFLWTPPHFWALALYRDEDYRRAGVPMLPVVAGKAETQRQIVLYTGLLCAVSLLPWMLGFAGAVYGVSAIVLGGVFLWMAIDVKRRASARRCQRLFAWSILYLFALFGAVAADHYLALAGWGL